MAYTVGEMAKRLGVPASTLRYYDKEGLLPFVGRSSGGIRIFEEKDFEWLRIIECLKKTGMSLKDIREYIELAMQGDATIAQRLEMFRKQKAVLDATGLARQPLTALIKDGAVDRERVACLLAALQQHSAPIKPQALGSIGQPHLVRYFTAQGCEMESFKYARDMGVKNGIPYVIEMAFAWHPGLGRRCLMTGVNWSAGILNPFRDLGAIGRGLDALLAERFAGNDEPILFLAHLAAARVAYSDRGKSAVLWEG